MNEQEGPITPLDPDETQRYEARALHEGYLHRTLVAMDIFINEVTGGAMDQTISTRAALAAQHGSAIGKALSEFLNVFQGDHGAKAAAGDAARAESELKTEQGVISETQGPCQPPTT